MHPETLFKLVRPPDCKYWETVRNQSCLRLLGRFWFNASTDERNVFRFEI